jgi:hypothetical protein
MDLTTVIVVVNHPKRIQSGFVLSKCKEVLVLKDYNASSKWTQYAPVFENGGIL